MKAVGEGLGASASPVTHPLIVHEAGSAVRP
jgi:hypothetical protein